MGAVVMRLTARDTYTGKENDHELCHGGKTNFKWAILRVFLSFICT